VIGKADVTTTRDRQIQILERIRTLKGYKSHRSLAIGLGIGYASYWRIREGESETLSEANLKKIYKFLDISEEEFASYLAGETGLDYATRNLKKVDPAAETTRSKGVLRRFQEEVLPYLTVPDLLEVIRLAQAKLFAWLPDYIVVRKKPMSEETRRLSTELGVPESKVVDLIAKIRELEEANHAQIPEADLIFLAHDVEVDIEVIYALQERLERSEPQCKARGEE
jgi:transcriptional regulator with XRE-family HTH domain